MSWREKLSSPATFRGVRFFVSTAELTGGRRAVRHEFPLRDVTFSEDLGRKGRDFPVEGHVVGDDYLDKRDALISALEEPGPGELVHPHYGTHRVAVSEFRVRESSDEGGVATFTITFEETDSAPSFPSATLAAKDRVASSGDAVIAQLQVKADAASNMSLPLSSLANVAGVLQSAAARLGQALGPILEVAGELASLKAQIASIILEARILVGEPTRALAAFAGLLDSVPSLDSLVGIGALLGAASFSAPETPRPSATTLILEEEQYIYDLIASIARAAMIVQAAKLAASAPFETYSDAVAARDAITTAIDGEAEWADDELFPLLSALRADVVRSVPGEASDLPRLVHYTPPLTVPSLVLAHRLYGDLDRELELVARNRVPYPGFVAGGAELEVLSAS